MYILCVLAAIVSNSVYYHVGRGNCLLFKLFMQSERRNTLYAIEEERVGCWRVEEEERIGEGERYRALDKQALPVSYLRENSPFPV